MVIVIVLYGELAEKLARWAQKDHYGGWTRAAGSDNFCEKGLMLIGELRNIHPSEGRGDGQVSCLAKWKQQLTNPRTLELEQAMTITREISGLMAELEAFHHDGASRAAIAA